MIEEHPDCDVYECRIILDGLHPVDLMYALDSLKAFDMNCFWDINGPNMTLIISKKNEKKT